MNPDDSDSPPPPNLNPARRSRVTTQDKASQRVLPANDAARTRVLYSADSLSMQKRRPVPTRSPASLEPASLELLGQVDTRPAIGDEVDYSPSRRDGHRVAVRSQIL